MFQYYFNGVSYQIIGAAYTVHRKLGPGLLEVLYKRAMCIELRKRNINFVCEAPFSVPYDTEFIGDYNADLLVK
jgi:GxxExxY protein